MRCAPFWQKRSGRHTRRRQTAHPSCTLGSGIGKSVSRTVAELRPHRRGLRPALFARRFGRVVVENRRYRLSTERIAIVGIGLRYPDAASTQELWENVLAGRRAFRRLPDERMNQADYYSPDQDAPDRF